MRDRPVSAFVIWEHVGETGAAPAATLPPPSSVLASATDPRVAQLWDPQDLVSAALKQSWPSADFHLTSNGVVWDTALVFPAGARWTDQPPRPVYAGGV